MRLRKLRLSPLKFWREAMNRPAWIELPACRLFKIDAVHFLGCQGAIAHSRAVLSPKCWSARRETHSKTATIFFYRQPACYRAADTLFDTLVSNSILELAFACKPCDPASWAASRRTAATFMYLPGQSVLLVSL